MASPASERYAQRVMGLMGASAKSNESADSERVDVVVIGGGPGGSTVAARLAQLGRRVVVLERARFPRFHIGESLLPASVPVLRSLGVVEELDRLFVQKHGARFLDDAGGPGNPASEAQYRFVDAFAAKSPYAWQVSRDTFDDVLLRNAVRLGVDLREGWSALEPITEPSHEGAQGTRVVGVRARDAEGHARELHASVVIDATGRDGFLSRRTHGQHDTRGHQRLPQLDKTAIFTHVRGGHRNEGVDAGQIEIIILDGHDERGGPAGWGWFIPFRDGRSSIGFVLSSAVVGQRLAELPRLVGAEGPTPREYDDLDDAKSARLAALLDAEVSRSRWMKHLIGDAPRVGPVRAAADYSFRVGTLAGDGWLAVGDAAGFIDPLFSTGAHLAIGGGDLAATIIDEALTAGDVSAARFDGYVKAVRAATELFLGAVQSFYRGELRDLLFVKPQRTVLRRTITSMLAGDVFHDVPPIWAAYFHEKFPAAMTEPR